MSKLSITFIALFLTACGDNPFSDSTKIPDTDYAQIRIEIERCSHISDEGSWVAQFGFSPKMSCLNHLKTRIVQTGKASGEFYK